MASSFNVVARSVLPFVAAFIAGCSSSDARSPQVSPLGGDGGNQPQADGGAAACAAGALASIPAPFMVDSLATGTFDSAGLVFAAIQDPRQPGGSGGGPNAIISVPVTMVVAGGAISAGQATTLFTSESPGFIGTVMADATTVYYAVTIGGITGYPGTPAGIYSIPRAGGAPKTLFTPKSGQSIGNFTKDASFLYFMEKDDFGPKEAYNIYALPIAGGTASPIYTSQNGQSLENLTSAGDAAGDLYWTESAPILTPATVRTIRHAVRSQTSLVQNAVATVPIGTNVAQLAIAPAGASTAVFFSAAGVLFADAGVKPLSGLYSVTTGGAPTLIDASGTLPIVPFVDLVATEVLYNGGLGIGEYDYPPGTKKTPLSNGVGVDAIFANEKFDNVQTRALVYSAGRCLYTVAGW